MSRDHRSRVLCAVVCQSMALLTQGCGGEDKDAIPAVPAAGTVNYKGKPVESGEVQFLPEKGRPAVGKIEGGKFRMTTYTDGDGAIPGKVTVTVLSTSEVAAKKKGDDPTLKYIIPARYASPTSSGVKIDIPPSGDKDLKIDLN